MKPIKFKGWHVKKQRMFSAEEMARDQLTLLTTGQFINVHGDRTAQSTIFPENDFIPIQCIGRQDKTGTEIYDGDLLGTSNSDTEKGLDIWKIDDFGPTEVFWNYRYARWDYTGWTPELHFHGNSVYEMRFVSIIGNIYENPELLESGAK